MIRLQSIVIGTAFVLLSVAVVLGQSSGSAPQAGAQAEAMADAARNGDAEAVKKLLDAGVDVNTKFRYGTTALSFACDRGHLDVVKLLLDRGADVNVRDTFYMATPLTWAVSPQMGRKPQHPEIVRLLLAKGAIDTLTIGLAREVAEEGIRVNAVRAGFIYTDIHASGGEPNRVDRVKTLVPMKRGGSPGEVAAAILWLLSDEASFVTGHALVVDGGILAD